MCEYALENWRRRVEQESFSNNILKEIGEARRRLKRKIVDSRVEGNHYEADKTERLVAWLNLTEDCMRKMLNNHVEREG